MQLRMDEQVVLVTGGSSGIGSAISRAFGQAGARVVVNYNSSKDKADRVVQQIMAAGSQAVAIKGDTSSEANVERLFNETTDTFGGIDILVANSGIQKDASIADMTLEEWQTVLNVNLTGQFLCACAEKLAS